MTTEQAAQLVAECLDRVSGTTLPDWPCPDLDLATDLGLDSLDLAVLMTHIEDRTGLRIPESLVEERQLSSVGNLVGFIESRVV